LPKTTLELATQGCIPTTIPAKFPSYDQCAGVGGAAFQLAHLFNGPLAGTTLFHGFLRAFGFVPESGRASKIIQFGKTFDQTSDVKDAS
jgi:hypothetical protein